MAEWYLELGHGYGYGAGYGYGYDDGYGAGYDDGHGDGSGELFLSQENAFVTLHFIQKVGDAFRLRNGKVCRIGEHLHEAEIAMCEKGLHASFTRDDAYKYAPPNSVLTEVKIWGRVIVGKDKMVATDRIIIREITGGTR